MLFLPAEMFPNELSLCHKLTSSNPKSLHPDGVNLRYFKLKSFDLTTFSV